MVGSQSIKKMLLDWKVCMLDSSLWCINHNHALLANTNDYEKTHPSGGTTFLCVCWIKYHFIYVPHVTLDWEIGANAMSRRCHWAHSHKAQARLETKKHLPNTQLRNRYLSWLSYLLQVCILTYINIRIVHKRFEHKD